MNTIVSVNLQPLWLSLKVAFCATVIAFVFGVLLAYLFAKLKFKGKDLMDAVLTLPLVLPPTVLGYYLIVLFGHNGVPGIILQKLFGLSLIFTWQGAVIASAIVSLPLVLKSARAAFENVDINTEDAARTLGSNEIIVFLMVSFPLAWRGILAGTMLAFARSLGEFGATLMLAGNLPGKTQTLSMAVYDAVQAGDDHLATTLVLITSCAGVCILYVSGKILKNQKVSEG
ncbi:MAG: molybdate ABC transporter permease subunit [Desulfobacterales bacterium]|nr:molybdate ABC transporter permease subunit [Desulfobacterales bacterium]